MATALTGILGVRRADVVRLVDHDQHRPALLASPPELGEHGGGGERLLLPRLERAEVDDEAAHVVPCELRQDRVAGGACPDPPAMDTKVPRAPDQLSAGAASLLELLELLE